MMKTKLAYMALGATIAVLSDYPFLSDVAIKVTSLFGLLLSYLMMSL